jgi:IclR family transcriptional regulator, KDG regulon repressor
MAGRGKDGSQVPDGSVQGLGYVSQAIQRALDVLDAIAEAPRGLTLTELSKTLDLPKSSVLRLIANLEMRHFVEQDRSSRYRIGLRVFSIGGQALADSNLRTCARPYLEDLAQRVGESTYLAILDQDQALYIDRIESPMPVLSLSPIGSHRPLHITAVGKVLLAAMGADAALEILGRRAVLDKAKTLPVEPEALRRRLEKITVQGYAVDVGEFDKGLTCLAAPIRDAHGDIIAALGVSGPSWRVTDERVPEIIGFLIENAEGVSAELGHVGEEKAILR